MATEIQRLANIIGKAVNEARNGGIAQAAIYNAGQVIVNGKSMDAEIIVPIDVIDGQKVFVQVSANDNKAYIIGS